MEKYRLFEDPSNGINPFIPDKISRRPILLKISYLYMHYNSIDFNIYLGLSSLCCFQ